MADPADIRETENWNGGFYELAIEVGDRSDDRLGRTLDALWRHAAVEGCFHLRRESEAMSLPTLAEAVSPTLESLLPFAHLNGVVRLPSGRRVVCGVVAIREDEGRDWLVFYLPMGALEQTDQRIGAFPFGDEGGPGSLVWRRPIDDWLCDVARRVYDEIAYRLALIGFEASGSTCAEDVQKGLPDVRGVGYVVPDKSGVLHVHAANC